MLNRTPVLALVDTGSSISVLDKDLFYHLKNNNLIKYKNLARAITITTLNSTVQFDACIEVSFKIENQHFKLPFYLVNTPPQSSFKAILGYDFLYKNHALINPKDQALIIKDISHPLLTSNFVPNLNDSKNNYFHDLNNSVNMQTVPKMLDIVDFNYSSHRSSHPSDCTSDQKTVQDLHFTDSNNLHLSFPVYTATKNTLQPYEETYIKLCTTMPSTTSDCFFEVGSKVNNLMIQDAIISPRVSARQHSNPPCKINKPEQYNNNTDSLSLSPNPSSGQSQTCPQDPELEIAINTFLLLLRRFLM